MKEGHITKENSIPFTGYLIEKTLDLYIYIKTPAYPLILCILTHANCNMSY